MRVCHGGGGGDGGGERKWMIVSILTACYMQMPNTCTVWQYSEWRMRGVSVLGSVLLMGSGVKRSLLMARWVDYTQNL